MTITPSPTYDITPREELIMDIMTLIDEAASCDEPVSSSDLAQKIVDLMDEKLVSRGAATEPTNLQGTSELIRKLVAASAVKYNTKGA